MGRKRKPDPTDGWSSWWSYQPVVGPIQTWQADFIDNAPSRGYGTDRRNWPADRDLLVVVDVRPGQCPADEVFKLAVEHGLENPFLGEIVRMR